MSDGGKGSVQRPITNRKTFEENWDAIFNKTNCADGNMASGMGFDTRVRGDDRKEMGDCGGAQHSAERICRKESTEIKP